MLIFVINIEIEFEHALNSFNKNSAKLAVLHY